MMKPDQSKMKAGQLREKVLIIDDEPATVKLFCMFLDAYGYESLGAESGEQGLEIFCRETPRIVFTDIKMPGMDGIEVLRRIKAINPDAEVVVITGHGDMDLALKALDFDATDFINKPIKRPELEKALSRASRRLELSEVRKKSIDSRTVDSETAEIFFGGNINAFSEPYIRSAYDKYMSSGCGVLRLVFNESVSINGAGMEVLGDVINDANARNIKVTITGLSSNFLKVFKELDLDKKAEIRS